MASHGHDHLCSRCHMQAKLLETFKKCSHCSVKLCNQCWTELQTSDEFKTLSKGDSRRLCSSCIQQASRNTHTKQPLGVNNEQEDDYQLALALSLSQSEADEKVQQQKRKRDETRPVPTVEKTSNDTSDELLERTAEAIARFMNRAKSNYQRNRDVIGDTALLSAFILLQTCATDLDQLKHDLDQHRQHFETLQEKLTTLRDAREALNILRYEHQQSKRQEQERLDRQRRLTMMQKVADLRQFKHNQIANFQETYLQRLLDEEQQTTERLKKQKLLKEEQFAS